MNIRALASLVVLAGCPPPSKPEADTSDTAEVNECAIGTIDAFCDWEFGIECPPLAFLSTLSCDGYRFRNDGEGTPVFVGDGCSGPIAICRENFADGTGSWLTSLEYDLAEETVTLLHIDWPEDAECPLGDVRMGEEICR